MGKTLVVGVGNSIMADDGLGVHALNELRSRELPGSVDTMEAGTAILDVLPDLIQYDKMILLDAAAADGPTVHKLRNPSCTQQPRPALSLHDIGVNEALGLRLLTDGRLPEIIVLGLKPRRIEPGTELSPEVASEISELVTAVLDEIR